MLSYASAERGVAVDHAIVMGPSSCGSAHVSPGLGDLAHAFRHGYGDGNCGRNRTHCGNPERPTLRGVFAGNEYGCV